MPRRLGTGTSGTSNGSWPKSLLMGNKNYKEIRQLNPKKAWWCVMQWGVDAKIRTAVKSTVTYDILFNLKQQQ